MTKYELSRFPNRLREIINRRGMKQRAIAEAVGITRNTLSRYLMGDRKPHPATLRALANHLGVTIEYLLGDDAMPLAESPVARDAVEPYAPDAVALTGLDLEDRRTVLRLLEALRSGDAEIRRHLIGQLKIIETAVKARRRQPRAEAEDAS